MCFRSVIAVLLTISSLDFELIPLLGPPEILFHKYTVPLGDWLEKKEATAIIIKQQFGFPMSTAYLNPEFHKILSRAFLVIAILVFSPYGARVDFKGLIY